MCHIYVFFPTNKYTKICFLKCALYNFYMNLSLKISFLPHIFSQVGIKTPLQVLRAPDPCPPF